MIAVRCPSAVGLPLAVEYALRLQRGVSDVRVTRGPRGEVSRLEVDVTTHEDADRVTKLVRRQVGARFAERLLDIEVAMSGPRLLWQGQAAG